MTRLDVHLGNGIIVNADLQPGYLHRGAEKLFEVRDYRSVLMLADRHDWQAAFSGELCVALTVESALGLVAPQRATWLRTLLAELARTHSHLAFLGYVPWLRGDHDAALAVRGAKDAVREAFADWSGNRVHPMLNRLGGLAADAPDGWLDTATSAAALVRQAVAGVSALLDDADDLRVGTLDADAVGQYGLSGPVSSASGVRMDARDAGYLAYGTLPPSPDAPDDTGDALARFRALAADALHAALLVDECAAAAPDGPVNVKLAKTIKAPEGTFWGEIAAPWGVAGCHLVSRGERTPWRLGLRTPTFANCSALSDALVGAPSDAVCHVVASLGYGIGDLDR